MGKSLISQNKHGGPVSRLSVVNSILEATAALLPRWGHARTNTNTIAERAGVSIGSLYYYFRSKDAIYTELADRVIRAYLERLEQCVTSSYGQKELHDALIDEVVEFTSENRELLKHLFAMASRLGKLETVFDLRNEFAKRLVLRLKDTESPLQPGQAFLLVNAVNGVLDNWIYASSCPFEKDELKRYLRDLADRLL